MAGKSPENEHPVKTFGWAARDSSGHFSPFNFSRRATGENDVRFKVLFCGICHTDLHFSRSDFGTMVYPMVPGHEIAGVVTEVGKNVTKLKVGDNVGVGCLVWSCKSCFHCEVEGENFCPKQVLTYGIPYPDGTMTYGGYSNEMVVDEHFAIVFPKNMPLDGGCPLLCAGITVYSAMKHYELNKPGAALGVVGLGGLGHVAVKFAKAFGCKVTVISHSASKKDEALNHFGADSFLVSSDQEEMQAAAGTLNGIVDSVSAPHDIMSLINLLKPQGKLITVGAVEKPVEVSVFPLIMGRRMLAGSSIGGLKDTQEMIDFAAKHEITADIEVIAMDYVNEAFERLEKGDVRYRFVIDIGNTLKSA